MRPTALPRLIAAAAALAFSLGACNGDSSDDTAGEKPTGGSGAASSNTRDVCFDRGKDFQGEARLYIEHNATDQDTGVHGMFDQEGLAAGCLEKPDGTQIMLVDPANQLNKLGINQFFFESREPPADQYSISDLKRDFPAGKYRISGIDFKGTRRVGSALFTHAIPAPPEIVSPKLVAEENADQNKLSPNRMTVRWKPVRETLDGNPVDIAGYEVIVTKPEGKAPNNLSQPEYDVHVPPDVTALAVPAGFLQPKTLYEVEVLALEDSGNQTISVGFFTTR